MTTLETSFCILLWNNCVWDQCIYHLCQAKWVYTWMIDYFHPIISHAKCQMGPFGVLLAPGPNAASSVCFKNNQNMYITKIQNSCYVWGPHSALRFPFLSFCLHLRVHFHLNASKGERACSPISHPTSNNCPPPWKWKLIERKEANKLQFTKRSFFSFIAWN